MTLAVLVDDQQPLIPPATLKLVSNPRFLFPANYLLDEGKNLVDAAAFLHQDFNAPFRKELRRDIGPTDVQAARQVLAQKIPDTQLRFEISTWLLLLSREFRLMYHREFGKNPSFSQHEALRMTDRVQAFITRRSFHSGHNLKFKVTPEDLMTSVTMYPMDAEQVPGIVTPQAAIMQWCRDVPLKEWSGDRTLVAYAKFFGNMSLVEKLYQRCVDACDPGLPNFLSEEQKSAAAKQGLACFWTVVDYIRWLTISNPLDR